MLTPNAETFSRMRSGTESAPQIKTNVNSFNEASDKALVVAEKRS